jgi:hypothetical protein
MTLHPKRAPKNKLRSTPPWFFKIEPILDEQVLIHKNTGQEKRRDKDNDYGDSDVRRSWRDRR